MKIHALLLLTSALFATSLFAQELTDQEIADRFAAQLELRQSAPEQGLGSQDFMKQVSEGIGRPVNGSAIGSSPYAVDTTLGNGTGYSTTITMLDESLPPAEVRVLKFPSEAAADAYLVHGDLEVSTQGNFALEQRGNRIVVIASDDMSNPERALSGLRETWNAISKHDNDSLIPPVRTRYARVGENFSIDSEIDDEGFVQFYDHFDYQDDTVTEHTPDGVRRIRSHTDLAAYGEATQLTDADRSPLRSRDDVGQFGKTRGLVLGGGTGATDQTGNTGNSAPETVGVGSILDEIQAEMD